MDWAQTTARLNEKYLSFRIYASYIKRFSGYVKACGILGIKHKAANYPSHKME